MDHGTYSVVLVVVSMWDGRSAYAVLTPIVLRTSIIYLKSYVPKIPIVLRLVQ